MHLDSFAVELYSYIYILDVMAIVITSSFITQLKSWDFIFIPKGLTCL